MRRGLRHQGHRATQTQFQLGYGHVRLPEVRGAVGRAQLSPRLPESPHRVPHEEEITASAGRHEAPAERAGAKEPPRDERERRGLVRRADEDR